MDLSNVNNTNVQNSDKKLAQIKQDDKAIPEHGGGGVHIPDKKLDSVTLSKESIAANNADVAAYHGGGGVHIPD